MPFAFGGEILILTQKVMFTKFFLKHVYERFRLQF